jgi:lipopolysaccharide/colanic/teichoic acid biosynthesis glycosyltransferase
MKEKRNLFFEKIVQSLSALSNTQDKSVQNSIHSVNEFRSILKREQERADRNGDMFSLLAFEVGVSSKQPGLVAMLIKIVLRRKRHIDEVGWFNNINIGVILPNTTMDGARKLGEDISSELAVTGPLPMFTIYGYPFDKTDAEDILSRDDSHGIKATSRSAVSLHPIADITSARYLCMKRSMQPYLIRKIPLWKRTIDIIGASLGLLCLFPIMLIIGALIKIVSPGPVFYLQDRVGLLGKPFRCIKFRTMQEDSNSSIHTEYVCRLMASEKTMKKLDNNDHRIIPFGKILRKTGLDELPQLINILRGEMSIVGPRPEIQSILPNYQRWHLKRFEATPGLTGLWQISGKNRTTFKEMMRADIDYVTHFNFGLDTKIILRTIPAILGQMSNR